MSVCTPMDVFDFIKRWKRIIENYFTYRRIFIVLIVIICLFLYTGQNFLRWLNSASFKQEDLADRCLNDKLSLFKFDIENFDAYIHPSTTEEDKKIFHPFVGNGLFGVSVENDSPIYVKTTRTLSWPIYWHPIVNIQYDVMTPKETVLTHYLSGTVWRYQCYSNGVHVKYEHYAHRTLPFLFVQDIKITNPTSKIIYLEAKQLQQTKWPTAVTHTVNLLHKNGDKFEYSVVSGFVEDKQASNKGLSVTIVTRKLMQYIEVGPQSSLSLQLFTAVHYSKQISKTDYSEMKDVIENKCIQLMKTALEKPLSTLRQSHIDVWRNLWSTGFYISYSKAANAINGDLINATIYYVLSSVRSSYYEEATPASMKNELRSSLSYAEGCYGSNHHTLQAVKIWGDLSTVEKVNRIVSYWLLTLEKQGCHNLVRVGASGVIQAMVLSFGGFRFSNQHLELNIHPQFLHREYHFRRLNYGNLTHVNVSVVLKEDNKAILNVALDRSDKSYYACDAGCLDDPVQLGPEKITFPVKLTDPVTPILYITSDKQHMELLQHAIHVKEVIEAPAHEHHVIALHKHGHHLGGLPTLFWVSVGFLIVVFHLFLFKLIYNEYCGKHESRRMRYGKL
ncbi:uncharacterized protein KIAA2013 homolog [Nilaparvata lugens]|uniref:uncharacterized protein KIAA2013 homolog n=1 Tax=Nilaparvata lugens TaxID=108931 RepID=UPI00193E91E3|nr:uncharacterized protein KIAA2013 homolog [Nilaparvata lugens]